MKNVEFEKRNKQKINAMVKDNSLKDITKKWFNQSYKYEYSYHFQWLGRPIIQYPQDIVAIQEIIWKVKPDLIIETGIAHGGSLIFSASMLELLGTGKVLGIDIDIRQHNKIEIEKHPLYHRITMLEGSSIDKKIANQVYKFAKNSKKILVILDSNHTYEHVLKEIKLYSKLVSKGSYLIVLDTIIDDMPDNFFKNRPWDKNRNPKSAVKKFLKENKGFKVDKELEKKLLISVAPCGYIKRVR